MTADLSIRVDRIVVRLRGVPETAARAVSAGLDHDLAHHITSARLELRGSAHVGDVKLGTVSVARDASVAEIRSRIASNVAAALRSRAGDGGREP